MTSAMFSVFGNSPCSTQQLNKLLMYGERIRVPYLKNLVLISFSLTVFFAFKERIEVATLFRRSWREKKDFLIVTSLLLVKCSVAEGISSDRFFLC